MDFVTIFVNIVRVLLTLIAIYYVYTKSFKLLKTVSIVFILTFLINILESVFRIKVDPVSTILFTLLIPMGLYLGSGLKFYDKFAWWDTLLHFTSGIIFVGFGIAFTESISSLNNFQILFFCITLSISLNTMWEICEYIVDTLSRSDHQRWQKKSSSKNHKSKKAVQPAGLVDTMKDAIMNLGGTLVTCVIWWFVL
ncbi:MAG: hypothetical protein FWC79_00500 [Oscillospiraceae bacterium]|nr:hypothetical protein [Oscillospiraceae bacterium]